MADKQQQRADSLPIQFQVRARTRSFVDARRKAAGHGMHENGGTLRPRRYAPASESNRGTALMPPGCRISSASCAIRGTPPTPCTEGGAEECAACGVGEAKRLGRSGEGG